jgi:hypothetical protein
VDGTDLGSYLVAGFGSSGAELLGSATTMLDG